MTAFLPETLSQGILGARVLTCDASPNWDRTPEHTTTLFYFGKGGSRIFGASYIGNSLRHGFARWRHLRNILARKPLQTSSSIA